MSGPATILTTKYGDVVGEDVDGIIRFRCVPFGDSVGGHHRWKAPRPPQSWKEPLLSDCWAPPVPQPPDRAAIADPDYYDFRFGSSYPTPYSEDGLYLNAWTPSLDPEAKRPVMVWLHGGGFVTGAPSRPRDDGTMLAAKGDVVVVAPNHRLGTLGYLPLGSLIPGCINNVGMLDIVLALRWVRDHARALGGDPNNVTVFGESGGAMKIGTLFAMPSAHGLFHRAICQAGFFMPDSPFVALTPDEALVQAEQFLDHVDHSSAPERLFDMSTDEIVEAQDTFSGGGLIWRPTVDPFTLPMQPHDVDVPVPLLLGSCKHEADFLGRYGGRFGPANLDELRQELGPPGNEIVAGYQANHPGADEADIIGRVVSDWTFRIPGIRLAERTAQQGQACFAYLFDWTRTAPPVTRATHSSDGVFAFGTLDAIGVTRGLDEARRLSDVMLGAWVQFARSADPAHPGLPDWPGYDTKRRATMVFAETNRVVSDPSAQDRLVWL